MILQAKGADLPTVLHRFCSSPRDLKPVLRGGLLPFPTPETRLNRLKIRVYLALKGNYVGGIKFSQKAW
jgi:hypothetical protein